MVIWVVLVWYWRFLFIESSLRDWVLVALSVIILVEVIIIMFLVFMSSGGIFSFEDLPVVLFL